MSQLTLNVLSLWLIWSILQQFENSNFGQKKMCWSLSPLFAPRVQKFRQNQKNFIFRKINWKSLLGSHAVCFYYIFTSIADFEGIFKKKIFENLGCGIHKKYQKRVKKGKKCNFVYFFLKCPYGSLSSQKNLAHTMKTHRDRSPAGF